MSDLRMIVVTLACTGLSLLTTYATWLSVRSQLLSMSAENEETP